MSKRKEKKKKKNKRCTIDGSLEEGCQFDNNMKNVNPEVATTSHDLFW